MGERGVWAPGQVFHVTNSPQGQEERVEAFEASKNASGRLPPGAVALFDKAICRPNRESIKP